MKNLTINVINKNDQQKLDALLANKPAEPMYKSESKGLIPISKMAKEHRINAARKHLHAIVLENMNRLLVLNTADGEGRKVEILRGLIANTLMTNEQRELLTALVDFSSSNGVEPTTKAGPEPEPRKFSSLEDAFNKAFGNTKKSGGNLGNF